MVGGKEFKAGGKLQWNGRSNRKSLRWLEQTTLVRFADIQFDRMKGGLCCT